MRACTSHRRSIIRHAANNDAGECLILTYGARVIDVLRIGRPAFHFTSNASERSVNCRGRRASSVMQGFGTSITRAFAATEDAPETTARAIRQLTEPRGRLIAVVTLAISPPYLPPLSPAPKRSSASGPKDEPSRPTRSARSQLGPRLLSRGVVRVVRPRGRSRRGSSATRPGVQAFKVGFSPGFHAAKTQVATMNQRFSSQSTGGGHEVLLRETSSVSGGVAEAKGEGLGRRRFGGHDCRGLLLRLS